MYDEIGFHTQNRWIRSKLRHALGRNDCGKTIQGITIDEPDAKSVLLRHAPRLIFNVKPRLQLHDISIGCCFRPSRDRPSSHSLPEYLWGGGKNDVNDG